MGKKFKNSLAGWFWFRVSHEVEVKMSAMAAVIRRLDSGHRIHFWDGRRRGLARWCWPLAGGLSSSYGELRAVWVSSQHGGWLRPERDIQESKSELVMSFFDVVSEVTHYHFLRSPTVTQTTPGDVGGSYRRLWGSGGKDQWVLSWKLVTTRDSWGGNCLSSKQHCLITWTGCQ